MLDIFKQFFLDYTVTIWFSW